MVRFLSKHMDHDMMSEEVNVFWYKYNDDGDDDGDGINKVEEVDNAGLLVDYRVVEGNSQLVGEGNGVVVDGGGQNDDDNDGSTITLLELAKTKLSHLKQMC